LSEPTKPEQGAGPDYRGDAVLFNRIAAEGRRTRLPLEWYGNLYRQMGLLPWLDGLSKDEPVLELGCCDALHPLNLSALTGRPAVGIDVSVESLRLGRREAVERRLSVHLAAMDALRTGLAAARFRTILFFGTLHHFFFGGLDEVVAEAARLLHPEGRMFVAEPSLLYPYHMVAFGGAHVIKRLARVEAIERTFTDHEMALWPRKLVRHGRRAGLAPVPGSLGYFDYVPLLPQGEGDTSPLAFRVARGVCRVIGRLGPRSWRHDMFHMTFEHVEP
jgi:SAM-dependent methyltransferase